MSDLKKLQTKNFSAPVVLEHGKLIATPLTRKDLAEDLAAANSSIEIINKTRGGGWPEEVMTEEFNELDLAWHEREFREGDSFAYLVRDEKGTYIGCFYLYPMGMRTEITDELADKDVDVSWWVTTEAYEKGDYDKLYKAVQGWLKQFPFQNPHFSNKIIP